MMPTWKDKMLPVTSLVLNPRNPRRHPQDQIVRLMASLARDGQTRPVMARMANKMLIAGHGVTMAAIQLGWTELSVRMLDVDQPTADRIMLADNRFSDLSSPDEARVMELLSEIDAADLLATGFTPAEMDKLVGHLEGDELRQTLGVTEIKTEMVTDTFWISVRGPLEDQAAVLQRIKVLLTEQPRVSIRLGTVEHGA